MPASLGELMVGLGVDFSGMNDAASGVESRMEQIGTRLYFLGSRIGAAFSAPLAGAIASVGDFGMAFDQAMTESLAIMNNVTPQIRTAMEDQARAIAETSKFGSAEAAKAYYDLASAGLDATQSMNALPIVARFAQGSLMEMSQATNVLAGALTGLGLKTGDATRDAQTMAHIGDVLTEVNNRALGTVTDFSAALTRSAATMRQYNIPIEEGVAVLGAYADQNIKGADAGTKFFMVIRDLTNAAIKHKDAFDQAFGPNSVFDQNGHLRNFADILDTVTKKFGGLSEEGKRTELGFLGLTSRSQQALLPLLGMGDRVRELTSALQSSGGAMDNVANNQMKSFQNQMKEVQNRFDNLKSELFDSFKPALTSLLEDFVHLIDRLKPIATSIEGWTDSHKKLAIEVIAFIGTLGTLITTLGGMALAISVIPGILTGVTTGFTLASGAMGAMVTAAIGLNPIVLAIVGIGAALLVLKNNYDSLPDQLKTGQSTGQPLKFGMDANGRPMLSVDQAVSQAKGGNGPLEGMSLTIPSMANRGGSAPRPSGAGDNKPTAYDIQYLKDWKKAVDDMIPILTGTLWDGTVESMLKLGGSVKDVSVYFGMTEGAVENAKKKMEAISDVAKIETDPSLRSVSKTLQSYGDVVGQSFFTAMDTTADKLKKVESGASLSGLSVKTLGNEMKASAEPAVVAAKAMEKSWSDVDKQFGAMAYEFGRLGREMGGTFGAMLVDISAFATSMQASHKGAAELSVGFADIEKGGKNAAVGLANVAQGALQVAGAFMAATNNASMTMNVLGGAAVGAEVGAKFGGAWGAAIGAAVGAIAALIKGKPEWAEVGDYVGQTMGVHISQKLAQSIVDLAKSQFNGNDQAATIASLSKIIGEAGGLNTDNMRQFVGTLRDTFSMVATGAMTAGQAAKNLDDNFANFVKVGTDGLGFLDDKLRELISLNDQYGTKSKAIADYLNQQTSSVISGFNAIVTGAVSVTKALDGTDSSVKMSQVDFDRMGRLAQAAFGSALMSGQTFLQAIQSIGPGLDTLSKAADTFKFKQTDAFGTLEQLHKFADANKDLMNELNGVNQMIVGLANSNALTQHTFTDLGTESTRVYAAMKNAGLESNEALLIMQPTLQTLWEAQQKYGFQVDDSTQALLNMAKEDNLVGETHKSVNEQMLDGINKLNDTMTKFVDFLTGETTGAFVDLGNTGSNVLGGLYQQIQTINGTTVHFNVETDYTQVGTPTDFTQNQPPMMASGGIAMGQRTVVVGDDGPEAIIPLDRIQSVLGNVRGGGDSDGSMTIQLVLDGRVITQKVLEYMPSQLRRNGIFT